MLCAEMQEVERLAMLRKSCLFVISILVILLASGAAMVAGFHPAQDQNKAIAIWEHGKTVLLFAMLTGCESDIYMHPQALVSADEGKTWTKSGPDLYGLDLKLISDTGEEVMVGGEYYIEGPTNSPFLLVYRDGAEWQQFSIYDGAAELEALAQDELRPNRFLAWVEHIDILHDDDMNAPIYLHQSLDRGRTWKVVKKVKSVPESAPHLRFFLEMPLENGRWRISEQDQPRARVEHIAENGQWQVVAKLPLPIQETCKEEKRPETTATPRP
jgi:hypothetical protein